jgi:hypothetical protein
VPKARTAASIRRAVGLPVPAIDHFGQVIDVLVSQPGTWRSFFSPALEYTSRLAEVVTDRALDYPRELDALVPPSAHRRKGPAPSRLRPNSPALSGLGKPTEVEPAYVVVHTSSTD